MNMRMLHNKKILHPYPSKPFQEGTTTIFKRKEVITCNSFKKKGERTGVWPDKLPKKHLFMTVQTVHDEIHKPADLQVQYNNSQIPKAKQGSTPIITSQAHKDYLMNSK